MEISVVVFSIVQTLAWDLVQFLMLHVFAKYGRPIESDTWALLRKKIEAVYKEQQDQSKDEETSFLKRMRAYDEITDHQIDHIMRTMISYQGGQSQPI